MINQPAFDHIRNTNAYRVVANLEITDYVMSNSFWVGVYPRMSDEMIDYVAKVISEAVNQ